LFSHYATKGDGKWYYEPFLLDFRRDEPTMTAFVGDKDAAALRRDAELELKPPVNLPSTVKHFVQAIIVG
jgi:hypothetical protein